MLFLYLYLVKQKGWWWNVTFLSIGKHFTQASKKVLSCQDKFQRMFQQNYLVV